MTALIARIKAEPALVTAFVASAIALITAFGFDLSNDQVGGIMAVVAAVLGFVTRSQVTPVNGTPPVSEVG